MQLQSYINNFVTHLKDKYHEHFVKIFDDKSTLVQVMANCCKQQAIN